MAARTTRTALVIGVVYGGLQDVAGALRGRPIGFVDALNRRRFGPQTTGISNTKPKEAEDPSMK